MILIWLVICNARLEFYNHCFCLLKEYKFSLQGIEHFYGIILLKVVNWHFINSKEATSHQQFCRNQKRKNERSWVLSLDYFPLEKEAMAHLCSLMFETTAKVSWMTGVAGTAGLAIHLGTCFFMWCVLGLECPRWLLHSHIRCQGWCDGSAGMINS